MEPIYSGGVLRSKLIYILQQENMKTWQFEKLSEITEDFIITSRISIYLENHENPSNLQCFFQLILEQMIEMCTVYVEDTGGNWNLYI